MDFKSPAYSSFNKGGLRTGATSAVVNSDTELVLMLKPDMNNGALRAMVIAIEYASIIPI